MIFFQQKGILRQPEGLNEEPKIILSFRIQNNELVERSNQFLMHGSRQ